MMGEAPTSPVGRAARAKAAAAAAARQALMPWQTARPDPEELPGNEVELSAWIEAVCTTNYGAKVHCEFAWFDANGLLSEAVDAGTVDGWELPPGAEGAVEQPQEPPQPPPKQGKQAKQSKQQKQEQLQQQQEEEKQQQEQQPQEPQQRTFRRTTTLEANCAFVRRLAGLSLTVRVSLPVPPPAPDATLVAGEAAAPVQEVRKLSVPLAPLLVNGKRGRPPNLEEDFLKVVGGDGFEAFRVGVRCSGPLLSEQVALHLNPMVVTLDSVHRLPHEEKMGQLRDSVCGVLDLFGKRRATEPRRLDERGGAKFRLHTVHFVGTWDRCQLRDYLQTQRVAVEIHDRGAPSGVSPEEEEVVPTKAPAGKAAAKKAAKDGGEAGKKAGAKGQPELAREQIAADPKGSSANQASAKPAPPPSSNYGLGRFSLAELLGAGVAGADFGRRSTDDPHATPLQLKLRVALEPIRGGTSASNSASGIAAAVAAANSKSAAASPRTPAGVAVASPSAAAADATTKVEGGAAEAAESPPVSHGDPATAAMRAALFGEGARQLLDSFSKKPHEFMPQYLHTGSYATILVEVARPIRPQLRLESTRASPVSMGASTPAGGGGGAEGQQGGRPPTTLTPPPQPTKSRAPSPQAKKAAKGAAAASAPKSPSPPPDSMSKDAESVGQPEATIHCGPGMGRYERYARVIIVLAIRDHTTLIKRLIKVVVDHNVTTMALDEAQAEAPGAVELTEEQKSNPHLDILTGFCLLDRRTRIFVIEGLREGALEKVLQEAQAGTQPNTRRRRVLYHPGVGFSKRLYADFNICLRQVKLRHSTLEALLQQPEFYDARCDPVAASALQLLIEMKRAQRSQQLKTDAAFPTVAGLEAVETQYGEFLQDEELHGGQLDSRVVSRRTSYTRGPGSPRDKESSHRTPMVSPSAALLAAATLVDQAQALEDESGGEAMTEEFRLPRERAKRKAALDTGNAAYAATLTQRSEAVQEDKLATNKAWIRTQSEKIAEKRKQQTDGNFMEEMSIYLYSGKNLELQRRAMEKEEKDTLWAYSQGYNTGLLDGEVNRNNALRAADDTYKDSRPEWCYPKPRDRLEFSRPDNDVSESRKDDLREAWDEGILSAKLKLREGVMHNAFDAKSLGTGGAHVIGLRRPGLRDLEGAPPPPPTRLEQEGPRCPIVNEKKMQTVFRRISTFEKYGANFWAEGSPE